ncbi:putative mitochondrial chaperone BCS1-B [Gracilariopsis chorda]|uniref:Putative mitochondrial chaperone BCS1-B n=1 Tax=Gracilariopsis chorda TaxID=448386 RepID=A0A2V3IEB6_9FLOR|nr:putative mitochondrial chaperone BCS1-B [Gracilariopsis chorda]|eukprot:PXF40392.1 putative mitochondrial chaperone BCS1-B [Gracilariopsis chorda]
MKGATAQNCTAFAPKASLSHFPPDYVEHIASALNVKPQALTTLTIGNDTQPVYTAILEYAAHYHSFPAHHQQTAPRNLSIAQNSPFESAAGPYDNDLDDSSDFANALLLNAVSMSRGRRLSRQALRLMREESDIQPGRGIREHKCPSVVPRVSLHLGDCVVLWPPPTHLMPPAVRSRRRELFEIAKAAQEYCSPSKKWAVDGEGVLQELVQSTSAPANEKTRAKPNLNHISDDRSDQINNVQDTERFDLFIAHYEIGLPVQDGDGSTVTERKILLATSNGVPALTTFFSGVTAWRFEKDRIRKHKHCCYELYRFRSECSRGFWESQGHRHARPIDSVVLAEGQMDNILDDVTNFLQYSTRKWFSSHGLSHRRSYLFYGKPGTGKTSTIRAIAGEFGLNCCFLSMTDASFSNQMLFDALREIPSNALLVLEDVDSLFHNDRSSKVSPSLTFS